VWSEAEIQGEADWDRGGRGAIRQGRKNYERRCDYKKEKFEGERETAMNNGKKDRRNNAD